LFGARKQFLKVAGSFSQAKHKPATSNDNGCTLEALRSHGKVKKQSNSANNDDAMQIRWFKNQPTEVHCAPYRRQQYLTIENLLIYLGSNDYY